MRDPSTRRRALLATLPALAVSGCSPLRLLNHAVPEDGYERTAGVAYGPHPRHRLDLYLPRAAGAGPLPLVVFFYGGAWQNGERGNYAFVGEALTSQGFAVAIPDYRVYPEVRFPGFVEDAALAVSWLQGQDTAQGYDPRRIFVAGHSAGAYLAAMVALDARYLGQHGRQPGSLRGMVGLAGPYDFLPLRSRTLQSIFGGVDGIPHTQPITFAAAGAPAALLLHGDADTTVLPRNTVRLAQRLRETGSEADDRLYPDMGHAGIVLALARPFQDGKPVLGDVVAFVQARA